VEFLLGNSCIIITKTKDIFGNFETNWNMFIVLLLISIFHLLNKYTFLDTTAFENYSNM